MFVKRNQQADSLLEQGCVSWQTPLGIETHTVKLGIVGAALHKGTAAHTAWGLCGSSTDPTHVK